jgi:hypothetical protein
MWCQADLQVCRGHILPVRPAKRGEIGREGQKIIQPILLRLSHTAVKKHVSPFADNRPGPVGKEVSEALNALAREEVCRSGGQTLKHRHTPTPEGVTKVHLPYLQEFRPCAAQRNKAPFNRFWRSRFNEPVSCRRSCLMSGNPG